MSALYSITFVDTFQQTTYAHSLAEAQAVVESLGRACDVKTLRGPVFETCDVVVASSEDECGQDFGCLESLSTELGCVQTEIRNHFYRDGSELPW